MRKSLGVLISVLALMTLLTPVALAGKSVSNLQVPFYVTNNCVSEHTSDVLAGGKVIVVNPMGNTALNITGNVVGLMPDTQYSFWMRNLGQVAYSGPSLLVLSDSSGVGWWELLYFTTDADGAGSLHLTIPADSLGNGTFSTQFAVNTMPPDFSSYGCTVVSTPYDPMVSISVSNYFGS